MTPTRRLAVWLAALVILFAALAPALAHTFSSQGALGAGTEICTSAGVRYLPVAGSAVPDDPLSGKGLQAHFAAFEHCPFCLHHAGHGALPVNPFTYLFLVESGAQVPVAWQAFFYFDVSRIWAPPRGPPATLLPA